MQPRGREWGVILASHSHEFQGPIKGLGRADDCGAILLNCKFSWGRSLTLKMSLQWSRGPSSSLLLRMGGTSWCWDMVLCTFL